MATISNANDWKIDSMLDKKQLEIIRKGSHQAEQEGKLTEEVLQLIYQEGWLKIMEPEICSGPLWSFPKIVRLLETLAYADGNVGWCVNLGAGANLFSGYLEPHTAVRIFTPNETWCAGSGAVSGTARKEKDGYRLSGKWKYASGAAHATHFTANAHLFDKQNQPILENGMPKFRSFIFPKDKVSVYPDWDVIGLKATSSHSFEADEIFIPENCVFDLTRPSAITNEAVFKFPFDVLAVVNMAIMPIGIAQHFLEAFETIMVNKIPIHATDILGANSHIRNCWQQCCNAFQEHRKTFYNSLEKAWQPYESGQQAEKESLDQLKKDAKAAAYIAQKIAQKLFPFCGMTILYNNSELNKIWRDLVVAGQHYLLSPMSEIQ